MSECAEYMDEAWRLYKNATRDLNWWRKENGDEGELRVIAARTWEAVSLAACVLLESRGVQPPPERRARRYALYYMEKEHPDIRARKMGVLLGAISSDLYVDCFHDGDCRPKNVIRSVTEDAREFLEQVAELTNGAEPAAFKEFAAAEKRKRRSAMSDCAEYMDEAWRLYKNATLDLNWWRKENGDEDELRVIAARTWEAVSLAACVLLESRGVQPPPERRARLYALYYMEKEHPDIRARNMCALLGAISSDLYVDCFHDGDCRPKNVIRSVTEKAREFLERVAALTNGAKPSASKEASDARVHG